MAGSYCRYKGLYEVRRDKVGGHGKSLDQLSIRKRDTCDCTSCTSPWPRPRRTLFLTSIFPSDFLYRDHATHPDHTTPESVRLRSPYQKPDWPRVAVGDGNAPISGSRSRSREMGRIVGARPCQKSVVVSVPIQHVTDRSPRIQLSSTLVSSP